MGTTNEKNLESRTRRISEYDPLLKPFWRYRATSTICRICPMCLSHRSSIRIRSNLRYLNSNARTIVLAYKVGLMMSGITARLREVIAQKYLTAVPKARNLTWALLIQALLNDKKLSVYLDDYGSKLAKEAAFRDILKQHTANRVAPLIKELFGSPAYKNKVAQEKYDFLRASEAFKKAMTFAMDKYDWRKKSF
jgi:hypothetical protein